MILLTKLAYSQINHTVFVAKDFVKQFCSAKLLCCFVYDAPSFLNCLETLHYLNVFDTLKEQFYSSVIKRTYSFDDKSLNCILNDVIKILSAVLYFLMHCLLIIAPQGSILGPIIHVVFLNQPLKTLDINNFVAYAGYITLTA